MRILLVASVLASSSSIAVAQHWQDATADCIGTTAQWTNKVEVADVDGDGLVDLLFANGGNYASPGGLEASRVWKNTGGWGTAGSHCTEISAQALGGVTGLSRVIKVGDVDGDGDPDILFGGAYQTQLRLFLRNSAGWTDGTAQLPQQLTSIGDLEFGDVDGDGDLDLLVAEWGATNPSAGNYPGGRTRLYLNDGNGTFADATTTHMPDILVEWSWDLELVDVDNDWDLDALISCKLCTTSLLYRNDGNGNFTNDPDALPHYANNYDFEAMDIDGDGDLDLATINDGGGGVKDTLLLNDGSGKFTDVSSRLGANPNDDSNIAIWLDVDSDGDADLLIGTLGTDRMLLNDGAGNFVPVVNVTPNDTGTTLGMAIADLDGDGRLDIVQGQGEGDFDDKIQLASTMVAVDTSPPVVRFEVIGPKLFARVHDHQSPSRAHDWQRVFAETATGDVELKWYGEYLWSAPAAAVIRVCGVDRQGNMGCADMPSTNDGTPGGDAGLPPIDQSTGCCDANQRPSATVAPFLLAFLLLLRRRRR